MSTFADNAVGAVISLSAKLYHAIATPVPVVGPRQAIVTDIGDSQFHEEAAGQPFGGRFSSPLDFVIGATVR